MLYLRNILFESSVVAYPAQAEFVIALSALIFAILLACCGSKVCNLVVEFVTINMVNVMRREMPIFDEPYKSMRCVFSAFELNIPVAERGDRSRNGANFDFWARFFLKQQPRSRVVL